MHGPSRDCLRRLLARALNRNQMLILSGMNVHRGSVGSLLEKLSDRHGVPMSSLRLNSRVLIGLGLINVSSARESYGNAMLSAEGRLVVRIMGLDA